MINRRRFAINVDILLENLESQYRGALSHCVAAKARYLDLLDDPSATTEAVLRARLAWERHTSRKHTIGVRMGDIDALEIDAAA